MARLALIGDYDAKKTAHIAIPPALERARQATHTNLDWEWIGTDRVFDPAETLAGFAGIWLAPGSPYVGMDGALAAVRHAREHDLPFLGTCGGFQHAVLEFARNVLGLTAADHAETASNDECLVISRLSCSLVEVEEPVVATPGSRLSALYGTEENHFGYHCNFGFNPAFERAFSAAGMQVSARDKSGEVRAMELDSHPFFIGTLFQPERLALQHKNSPLVDAFIQAATIFRDKET